MIHAQQYDQLYKQLNDSYREIKRLSNENLALKMELDKSEKALWEMATKLYKAENDTASPAARNTTSSA